MDKFKTAFAMMDRVVHAKNSGEKAEAAETLMKHFVENFNVKCKNRSEFREMFDTLKTEQPEKYIGRLPVNYEDIPEELFPAFAMASISNLIHGYGVRLDHIAPKLDSYRRFNELMTPITKNTFDRFC